MQRQWFSAIISMGRMLGRKFKEDNKMTGKCFHGKRRKRQVRYKRKFKNSKINFNTVGELKIMKAKKRTKYLCEY